MGLETATDGSIEMHGRSIQDIPIENRDTKTVSSVQMVFQNPFDTLNPSMTVGRQIIPFWKSLGLARMIMNSTNVCWSCWIWSNCRVNLRSVCRASCLVARNSGLVLPEPLPGCHIVVADEPVSALDVSVQAAVTELLMETKISPAQPCCLSAMICRLCVICLTVWW